MDPFATMCAQQKQMKLCISGVAHYFARNRRTTISGTRSAGNSRTFLREGLRARDQHCMSDKYALDSSCSSSSDLSYASDMDSSDDEILVCCAAVTVAAAATWAMCEQKKTCRRSSSSPGRSMRNRLSDREKGAAGIEKDYFVKLPQGIGMPPVSNDN